MSATPNTFDDPDRSEHLRASPPLLPWPMLDRFTRVHPAVPALLYLPVVAVHVGYAHDGQVQQRRHRGVHAREAVEHGPRQQRRRGAQVLAAVGIVEGVRCGAHECPLARRNWPSGSILRLYQTGDLFCQRN